MEASESTVFVKSEVFLLAPLPITPMRWLQRPTLEIGNDQYSLKWRLKI
jgi:hypothetical protein